MSEAMIAAELSALVARVFQPTPEDRLLGIMVDLPDGKVPDDAAWTARRQIAAEWARLLDEQAASVGYGRTSFSTRTSTRTTEIFPTAAGFTAPVPCLVRPPTSTRQPPCR